MKAKNGIVLLLVLAMMFSFSACGSSTSYPYQNILDAETKWVADTDDLQALSVFIAGDFASDEMYTILDVMHRMDLLDLEGFFDSMYGEHDVKPGGKVQCEVRSEEEMSSTDLLNYTMSPSSLTIKLSSAMLTLQSFKDQLQVMDDDQLSAVQKELEDAYGLPYDEFCDAIDELMAALQKLSDKLSGAEVSKGVKATLRSKYGDDSVGETMEFICIGDDWAPGDVFDVLSDFADTIQEL